jgi:hypothetical protein
MKWVLLYRVVLVLYQASTADRKHSTLRSSAFPWPLHKHIVTLGLWRHMHVRQDKTNKALQWGKRYKKRHGCLVLLWWCHVSAQYRHLINVMWPGMNEALVMMLWMTTTPLTSNGHDIHAYICTSCNVWKSCPSVTVFPCSKGHYKNFKKHLVKRTPSPISTFSSFVPLLYS